MNQRECTYGLVKRFRFIEAFLDEHRPASLLDVGCGTGNNLTVPLAERFPDIHFTASDSDAGSIEYAQQHNKLPNLSFRLMDDIAADERFDVVMASEVIEHVEDPKGFLQYLHGHTAEHGRVILTTPNGYGAYEFGAFIQNVLCLSGAMKVILGVKRALFGRRKLPGGDGIETPGHDTLAVSPHINFFGFGTLKKLIRSAAFNVDRYKPRTFLCGFLFDQTVRWKLVNLNARIADWLPARMNAGWMFVLKNDGEPNDFNYRRGPWARFRRRLNEKQFGVPPAEETPSTTQIDPAVQPTRKAA